ncbi:MAG: type II/IV secretion system ATPase subunit, partial [Thermoplasmata archaeon]|nr:type II/IV secretion system ATPase subunit [Thermoplasmata archaeon]
EESAPEKKLKPLPTKKAVKEEKKKIPGVEEKEEMEKKGEIEEEVTEEEEKVEGEREEEGVEEEEKEVVEEERKRERVAVKFNIRTIFSPLTKIAEAIGKRKRAPTPDLEGVDVVKVARPRKVPRTALETLPPPDWEFLREYDISFGIAKVRIYLDPETSSYIYWVIEPPLTEGEKNTLERIKKLLHIALPYSLEAVEEGKRESYLLEHFQKVVDEYRIKISEKSLEKLKYYVTRDFLGYNKIDPIMHDPHVEDVSCDGPEIPIYLYHRDYGSIKTNVIFENDEVLDGFVVSLAQKCRKTISVANPILDATLPDGSRLNATYGREITTRGSSFTIRKFREEPLTVVDLVENNTMSDEMAAHFWLAVQYGESMIFAGGTASGKTSTMNAISIFIPPSSKIISIEDTREVNLPHENWIAGITRGGAEAERPGDIGMYDLLRAALRQRPEYVIVGEVRGKETMTMFQAMATGHTTYSTMHADSVKSIVYRLENPPISIPRVLIQALNLVAIHKQIKVKDKRVRRITEIVEIVDIEPTTMEVVTNQVFRWNPRTDTFIYGGHSNLYEKIMDLEDMSREEVLEERDQRAEVIRWMVRNGVRKFWDVARVVAEYYEDSERTLSIIRKNPEVIGNPLEVFEKRGKGAAGVGRKATEAPA